MDKLQSLSFSVLGVSLIVVGILLSSYPLLDRLANIDFAYLVAMLGLAILVVGIHCQLFASPVGDLPLLPNVVIFVVIASAANVNIIWDAVVLGADKKDMWLGLSNSTEFSVYYAAFLFLPRWRRKRTKTQASLEPGTD